LGKNRLFTVVLEAEIEGFSNHSERGANDRVATLQASVLPEVCGLLRLPVVRWTGTLAADWMGDLLLKRGLPAAARGCAPVLVGNWVPRIWHGLQKRFFCHFPSDGSTENGCSFGLF